MHAPDIILTILFWSALLFAVLIFALTISTWLFAKTSHRSHKLASPARTPSYLNAPPQPRVICMDCGCWISGPDLMPGVMVSHGLCELCKPARLREIEALAPPLPPSPSLPSIQSIEISQSRPFATISGSQSAFTLIELLICLCVLCVLCGLFLPVISRAYTRARDHIETIRHTHNHRLTILTLNPEDYPTPQARIGCEQFQDLYTALPNPTATDIARLINNE